MEVIEQYRIACPVFADMLWKETYFDTEKLMAEVITTIETFRGGPKFLKELRSKETQLPNERRPYFFLAMCIGYLEVIMIDDTLMIEVDNERYMSVHLGHELISFDCHGWWNDEDCPFDEPLSYFDLRLKILSRHALSPSMSPRK